MKTFIIPVLVASTLSFQTPSGKDDRGKSLIGTIPPELNHVEWLTQPTIKLQDLRGKVVLIRWWTAPQCPFCAPSIVTLNNFTQEFGGKGLMVIGLYHHKSSRPLTEEFVTAQVNRLGVRFAVGIDKNWNNLDRWWLQTGDRGWTSVSFLLDRGGSIRYVHPGGAYSAEPLDIFPEAQEDYRTLRSFVEQLLNEEEAKN